MNHHRARFLSVGITAAVLTATLAACSSGSSSSGGSSSTPATTKPILIGTSLSLTGDFSADGQAFLKGYKLWVADVNASGGLLGRKVKLIYLNDRSDPGQVVTNYTTLISTDHVDLTFGPFSSLLTTPASAVAARNGFAFIEGAGGAPSVFTAAANEQAHNVFDVSLPIEDEMVPFANWVTSLPASQRPKTAAYPMADDPFADPPVQLTQTTLQKAGIKTVYSKIFPAEVPDYAPAADNVAASHADVVVLGSTDVPTVGAFMKAFQQQHYTPKIFIAAAGPDQGAAFTSAVGAGNAAGIMVPNGWYGSSANAQSQKMVAEYIKLYHGTPSSINADVAEGYAVGQVAQQAVEATKSVDNAKIITYLHSGVTLNTVQGQVKFDSLGRNGAATTYIFQWQNGKYVQVLPVGTAGSVSVLNPKPAWKNG
ncbi:MAG TPA: amino acid ABC transporter substrate-binding protein [Streptosporangiaceae bacterium]|nr:amino acid ABC transporter substrate-binding protein [Streptosporangiaceae bacterium]